MIYAVPILGAAMLAAFALGAFAERERLRAGSLAADALQRGLRHIDVLAREAEIVAWMRADMARSPVDLDRPATDLRELHFFDGVRLQTVTFRGPALNAIGGRA